MIFHCQLTSGKMLKCFLWSCQPKCYWPVRLQDFLKCNFSVCVWINRVSYKVVQSIIVVLINISKEWCGRNIIFCMKTNNKVFHELIVLFLKVKVRHAQIIQNSKFVISFQYLIKEGGIKLIFYMQVNSILSISVGMVTCSNYPK